MSKCSILLLGTQIATGGAQKVLLDQAGWFHERGHKVAAAFFYDRDGLYKRWQDVSAFPIYDLRAFRPGHSAFQNAVSLPIGLWRLWSLIRREKFDVIESFTQDSNLLGLPLAWLAGVPVRIGTYHGVMKNLSAWRQKAHTWVINYDIASLLVAVSDKTRQRALDEGVMPDRISVIRNGITLISSHDVNRPQVRKEAGVAEGDPFLLSVGRLVYEKGHEYLIHAMPAVLNKFPSAKLGICGEGILRPELESLISRLRLGNSVRLFGNREDVASFLAIADVFVLPSRSEGLPIALLEAMSAGLPVVATQVDGADETVQDGENGFLVPVGDTNALANAIIRLLEDPQFRHQMGLAAKTRIRNFYALSNMCEQYLSIMLEYLGKE